MKISAILSRAVLSIAFLTASVASATPLTWTLQGVTFADGASATGSFVTESTTGDMLSWNITTSAGPQLAGFTYDASTSYFFGRDAFFFANSYHFLQDPSENLALNLTFASALMAPGTVNLVLASDDSGSFECDNCFIRRSMTAGSVVSTTQVPEPAPLALFGLAAVALVARRKLQK